MRSLRSVAVITALLIAASAPGRAQQGQQGGQQVQPSLFETRLFPLQFMSNQDAASLITPFVQVDGRYGVFDAGAAVRGITVRASKDILTRVDSLLKAHDRAPVSTVLRFQLIAALDSNVRDAAIPANVDATLRDLFRFGGYRVLAQASATVGTSNFEVTMASGTDRYTINGTMGSSRGSAGRGRTVAPSTSAASSLELSVNLMGMVETIVNGVARSSTWQTLLSTGLAVPMGETVVLGSAAATTDGRRALILTVRPEVLGPRR